MKKSQVIPDILVEKLVFSGAGIGTLPSGKKVILSGGVIPGSRVSARVIKVRSRHIEAQAMEVIMSSPLERSLPAHWQVYGGCRWLPIAYPEQLQIKSDQAREIFAQYLERDQACRLLPIQGASQTEGYRNKVEFSWGKYISQREGRQDEYCFGFHVPGQFDRIENCRFCVLASIQVNKLFQHFDAWARESSLPTYDPKSKQGFWRHLVIREGARTWECMVTLSVRSEHMTAQDWDLFHGQYHAFLSELHLSFPKLRSAYLLANNSLADIVLGEWESVWGRQYIIESIHIPQLPTAETPKEGQIIRDYYFEIFPESFFQVNTLMAEQLFAYVRSLLKPSQDVLLDLFAGTGTFGILLADLFAQVVSVEIVPAASECNKSNCIQNNIQNVTVVCQDVEAFLKQWKTQQGEQKSDAPVIVLDPPRSGLTPDMCQLVLEFKATEIIYVSCNPSTLVRDLNVFLASGRYRMTSIQPFDMFPHTHHMEVVVHLQKTSNI